MNYGRDVDLGIHPDSDRPLRGARSSKPLESRMGDAGALMPAPPLAPDPMGLPVNEPLDEAPSRRVKPLVEPDDNIRFAPPPLAIIPGPLCS